MLRDPIPHDTQLPVRSREARGHETPQLLCRVVQLEGDVLSSDVLQKLVHALHDTEVCDLECMYWVVVSRV